MCRQEMAPIPHTGRVKYYLLAKKLAGIGKFRFGLDYVYRTAESKAKENNRENKNFR
jgi:hypothetical protein